MPDWSYHTIFKPILHRLPPVFGREFIHRGMNTISSIPFGEKVIEFLGHMETSPALKKELFGISFPSAVGLSGKIDPCLTGTKAFQHLGFGFLEIGPITKETINGKDLRLDRRNEQITFIKSESIGLIEAEQKLSSLKERKVPLLLRLEGTMAEIYSLTESFLAYADVVVIKYKPDYEFQDIKTLKSLLNNKSLILTISNKDLQHLLQQIPRLEIDGIMLEEDFHKESSQQLQSHIQSIRQLNAVEVDLPILTVGGIKEPQDAIELFTEGASLVLLNFEYVFSGPGLPKRINEVISQTSNKMVTKIEGWIWYYLFGFCILLAGLLTLIFSMTKVILPYDELFLQMVRGEIIEFNSLILNFMAHDRMTLAGTMVSGGFIYMQLSKHGIRNGFHWARKAVNVGAIIGFLGIFLFIGYGYFDWLHGLFWLILLPLFIKGFLQTKPASLTPSSINLTNHTYWRWSLIGQLSFVILGFSLTIGGIVISIIGATTVFVPTDITYLCMTADDLHLFNSRLIPVIAHDRAGFGSALLSVGLLVLMIALWGIREGERWIWWTLFIGAIPAFLSGIITHYVIGYTDFIHLLPAYLAFFFYVIGIIFLAPFLLKGQPSKR